MKLLTAVMLLIALNPLWPIGENPAPGHPFLIVNKKTNELAYIDEGKIQQIFPVATGLTEELTPEGLFTIIVKAENPYYRKKNIAGGSKKNPLGSRWMGFDALETDGRTYGIHGNNNPDSIGKYITQGCIRMHEEHIQMLYKRIPAGTKLLVVVSDKSFAELGKTYRALN